MLYLHDVEVLILIAVLFVGAYKCCSFRLFPRTRGGSFFFNIALPVLAIVSLSLSNYFLFCFVSWVFGFQRDYILNFGYFNLALLLSSALLLCLSVKIDVFITSARIDMGGAILRLTILRSLSKGMVLWDISRPL
jgi:hypothetical protein